MANYFELSDTYIEQLKEYRDETTPLSKVLENSQNILFQAYLTRRNSQKEGYFDDEIAPFIFLRHYQGNGRFILCDINAYKEGWHREKENVPSENKVSSPVLDLLDDSVTLKNNDDLAKSLETYPTITDWFKRLLDKIPFEIREEISLDGIKIKKFQEILKEEKQNIIKEESIVKEEKPSLPEKKKEDKHKRFIPKGKQTKKIEVKTVSFKYQDEFEEKKLIALQERANNLSLRIKKKVGIHFGWDELFVYARNGSDMLTMIDKKVRKKGLKSQDNDWIIVATYTVEDEDFAYIKEHYPTHTFRSDDIAHKPSAEFVSLAIVVSPIAKSEAKPVENEVKKVSSKAVSFVNLTPEVGYSASENLPYEDEEEEIVVKKPNDGIIKKVKFKGAIFNSHVDENPSRGYSEDEFDDSSIPLVPNDGYIDDDPDEIEIPKHWKCPLCPSKNPWHTEEPARIIRNSDGSCTYLCKKHKNSKIN